jgi:hypothetical protein
MIVTCKPWQLAVVLLGLALSPGPTVLAAVIRVAPTGPGGDGSSWEAAATNLVTAVGSAAAGDSVWVATGTYSGNVRIPPGVEVLGGFRGDETTATQRNARRFATRLNLSTNRLPAVTFLEGSQPATFDGFRLVGTQGWGPSLAATNAAPRVLNVDMIHPIYTSPFWGDGRQAAWSFVNADFRIQGCQLIQATFFHEALIDIQGGQGQILANRFIGIETFEDFQDPVRQNVGTIVLDGGSPLIERNWFAGNRTDQSSGVIALRISAPIIRNNLFTDQRSVTLLADTHSAPRFLHNTVSSGFYGPMTLLSTNGLVANNLFAFGGQGPQVAAPALLLNNGWIGLTTTAGTNPVPLASISGNILLDSPFIGEIGRGHVMLRTNTAAIDAGVGLADGGATDFFGNPRVRGTAPDLGAFESDGIVPILPTTPIIRVKPDGDDSLDGATWATAKRTLNAGLDDAVRVAGDVWVAAGTYHEPGPALRPMFILGYLVSAHGGFAGTESSLAERDFRRNRTILDGAGAHLIMAHGTFASVGPQALRVAPAVSGFTFQNGFGRDAGAALLAGALRVHNNRFQSNQVAVAPADRSQADPLDLLGAAALRVRSGSEVIANEFITNVVTVNDPRNNSGGRIGGALVILGGDVRVRDNLFQGNSMRGNTQSGGPQPLSPSISLASLQFNAFIENNTFVNNTHVQAVPVPPILGPSEIGVFRTLASTNALEIRNNLFASSIAPLVLGQPSVPVQLVTAYNCVFGGATNLFPAGASNIFVNPRFASGADFPRLATDSPLRDAGDPATITARRLDLDGRPRQFGDRVDIGAYEYTASSAPRLTFVQRPAGAGTLGLDLTIGPGPLGGTVVLESSSDLRQWSPVGTNLTELPDLPIEADIRFFRAMQR